MAQDYSQVNFRIPTKLKEDIEKASLANNRSITAELVSRLEQSFMSDDQINDLTERVELLEKNLLKVMQELRMYDPNKRD
ncbi:Arc family DNA-binding protein [Acinetobacter soli]|uniref:Arc family DNA-binding protein n=1 Tax=Acinetobacter soli TaxID=487316 RepID=UPI00124FBC72|nr:Arc family DNA-binding protein [Acinetobacter soli]